MYRKMSDSRDYILNDSINLLLQKRKKKKKQRSDQWFLVGDQGKGFTKEANGKLLCNFGGSYMTT